MDLLRIHITVFVFAVGAILNLHAGRGGSGQAAPNAATVVSAAGSERAVPAASAPAATTLEARHANASGQGSLIRL